MPTNLNALIRYKTINSCLYGGKRRWRIKELIEACSNSLADARGRYESISERTIRDDIRIMRSDILGFNAPIKQKFGLYFYSEPYYSIMNIKISDSGLIDQIIKLLLELRTEIQHPELESVLKRLFDLSEEKYFLPEVHQEPAYNLESSKVIEKKVASSQNIRRTSEAKPALKKVRTKLDRKLEEDTGIGFMREPVSLRWEDVFKVLK
jgi:hypothetical protein